MEKRSFEKGWLFLLIYIKKTFTVELLISVIGILKLLFAEVTVIKFVQPYVKLNTSSSTENYMHFKIIFK